MIDIKTGHLLINNEHIITPQTSLAMLDKFQLGTSQKTRRLENNWNWVDVKNLKIDEQYLNISFLFKDEKIESFTFVFQDKPYDLNPNWASWNKETERSNLARFNHWLDEQFGAVRALEWGKIEANYDLKSMGSSIKLTYGSYT